MPSAPIIQVRDAKQLVRAFLLEKDTVTALCDDRIYPSHPEDPDSIRTYPIVILDFETGTPRYQGGLQQWNVDVYAYSNKGQDHADTLYDAVYLAMQAARIYDASGTITAAGSMREIERPEPGYNGQTMAHFARGTWVLMLAG